MVCVLVCAFCAQVTASTDNSLRLWDLDSMASGDNPPCSMVFKGARRTLQAALCCAVLRTACCRTLTGPASSIAL